MDSIKKDTFFKYMTKKPVNPLSEEEAINLCTSFEDKYGDKIKEAENSDYYEKARIAKNYLETLTEFKKLYDEKGNEAFKEHGVERLEYIWLFDKLKKAFSSLSTNINSKALYEDCDHIFSELFVRYYYETLGTKIFMESEVGLSYFSLDDTEPRELYGKQIEEDELKKNPDSFIEITRDEAYLFEEFFMQDLNSWYSLKVRKAVTYALFYFTGRKRKISGMPFISHALDTMIIASTLTIDQNVLVSAMLHGILKNTDADPMEIKKYFGLDVAKKVVYINGMEDNMNNRRDWTAAKKDILYKLENAPMAIKIIILSNELSKLREIDRDFQTYKDSIWERFSETDKRKHRWYHEEVLRNMYKLRISYAYEEYQKLIYLHLNNTYN